MTRGWTSGLLLGLVVAGLAPAGTVAAGAVAVPQAGSTAAVSLVGGTAATVLPAGATTPERLLVGDSLGVSVQVRLQDRGYAVDAQVGRQFSAAPAIVRGYGTRLPRNVVIELGTNGTIAFADCKSVVRAATRQRRVFLVTSRVPRSWEQENLSTVQRCNRRFARPRVRVIDWYGRSGDHPDWFAADGVHLSTTGQRAFVRTINRAVTRKGLA